MLDPDLVAFVHGGVAVTVGTRDTANRPAVTRAWGPEVSADRSTLKLCVIAPRGSSTRANLERNGTIAVGFSPPAIARALQIKGAATSLGRPQPADLQRAERHLVAFSAEVERVGISSRVARRIFGAPSELLSVRVSIDEVFDQTPGPRAGRLV